MSTTGTLQQLANRKCEPCRGDVPPMRPAEVIDWLLYLPNWEYDAYKKIRKTFRFKDFANALQFVNRLGEVAEGEGHHPDIGLEWGKVEITWWTHKIKGLSEADFILAARTELLYQDAAGRKG